MNARRPKICRIAASAILLLLFGCAMTGGNVAMDTGAARNGRVQTDVFAEGADVEFDTDASLIAGTRVEFSAATIDSTLSDALVFLRERVAECSAPEDKDS